jgi:sulfite reductase beta subunit-like hemoprotein
LSVVEIEDGKAAIGLLVVAGREIDDEVALIAKEARAKGVVFAELTVTHEMSLLPAGEIIR